MSKDNLRGDLSEGFKIAFAKARLKFLKEQAAINGMVVLSDKDGNIKRVPAKELLETAAK